MRCPYCSLVQAESNDLCRRCFVDLRPLKATLGLSIKDKQAPYESLLGFFFSLRGSTPSKPERVPTAVRNDSPKSMQSTPQELPAGTVIADRFVIEHCLGHGSAGAVYLAQDSFLRDERVALKLLRTDGSLKDDVKRQFFREIQTTRLVTDTSVVRTFDAGIWDGRLFFTMEYLVGITLAELLDEGPLPIPRALRILLQLCRGVGAIHTAKVLHRDIKAENIILTNTDQVKIADFGIAHPIESSLIHEEFLSGSVPYMAPEIWLGEPLSVRTDIYALGVVAYEMITGVRPFDADQTKDMIVHHLRTAPEPLTKHRPDTPEWLCAFIRSMLSKQPVNRPSSAGHIKAHIVKHCSRPRRQAEGRNQTGKKRKRAKASVEMLSEHHDRLSEAL